MDRKNIELIRQELLKVKGYKVTLPINYTTEIEAMTTGDGFIDFTKETANIKALWLEKNVLGEYHIIKSNQGWVVTHFYDKQFVKYLLKQIAIAQKG